MDRLTHAELLELKRWNTPTIYNGWEQITKRDVAGEGVNQEECCDFMPQMGTMVGYAVTLKVEPSVEKHKKVSSAWADYRESVASVPGPKIVVVQGLTSGCSFAATGVSTPNVMKFGFSTKKSV